MMRVLIVDDSAEDRLNLRALLERLSDVEIVGEVADLSAARQYLSNAAIDLLFLDIQLGRENGFDLLQAPRLVPRVIITTVHRDQGERAFDFDVTDYLVKPVTEDRLQRALDRAQRTNGTGRKRGKLVAVHRSGSARQMVALDSIAAIIGDDKYSRVIAGSNNLADYRTLRQWEELLRDHGFTRIDRSTLLRPDQIVSVLPFGRGAKLTLLQSKVEIEVGRVGRERLAKTLSPSRS